MKYNILLVEDDQIQRRATSQMLGELDMELNIFEAEGINSAMNILKEQDIDLFYVDQHLQDGSGIEFGKAIREIEKYRFTWVVFVTSHSEFMLEAFKKIHCYDYLMKPVIKEELQKLTRELLSEVGKEEPSTPEEKTIEFKSGGIQFKIPIDEICYVEVIFKNCYIHTKKGTYKANKLPLSKLQEQLVGERFLQCHRAYIINTAHASKMYRTKGSWYISFSGMDKTALVGTTYRKATMERLQKLNIMIATC